MFVRDCAHATGAYLEVGAGVGVGVGDCVGLHAQINISVFASTRPRRSANAELSRHTYKPDLNDTTIDANRTGRLARMRPDNLTRDCSNEAIVRMMRYGSHLDVGGRVGAGVSVGDGLRIHPVRTKSRPRSLPSSDAQVRRACLCMHACVRSGFRDHRAHLGVHIGNELHVECAIRSVVPQAVDMSFL